MTVEQPKELTMNHTTASGSNAWPVLPTVEEWQDTYVTVHMWLQIVGKVRLALSPWVNHSWGSALYLTPRGLTTSPIQHGETSFAIDFDFVDHMLRIQCSTGQERSFALSGPAQSGPAASGLSVAQFYERTFAALGELGISVKILARPVEVPEAIPFAEDHGHASYDADAISRVWRAMSLAAPVFAKFRARFTGKVSPVHFFWGAFDLAVTRFSGRPAPKHPGGAPNCADWVMEEAYSRELSSAGFWPGMGLGEAAFYSYAYPAPPGFADAAVLPADASYNAALGEFVLPYDAVRRAADPEDALSSFLQSTYDAAATLADWDRSSLEVEAPPQASR